MKCRIWYLVCWSSALTTLWSHLLILLLLWSEQHNIVKSKAAGYTAVYSVVMQHRGPLRPRLDGPLEPRLFKADAMKNRKIFFYSFIIILYSEAFSIWKSGREKKVVIIIWRSLMNIDVVILFMAKAWRFCQILPSSMRSESSCKIRNVYERS